MIRPVLLATLLVAGNAMAADAIEAERLALAATPGYDGKKAYLEERDVVKKAGETWRLHQRRDAIRILEDYVQQHPLSPRALAALRNMANDLAVASRDRTEAMRLGGQSRENAHMLSRVMDSISHGTQCASVEDACKVIHIGEEQAFLEYKGALKTDESLRVKTAEGVPFDVLTVTDAEGRQRKYYFDISPFFKVGPK